MRDVSIWITSIASVASALAAWRMWKVSQSTLSLQETIEKEKQPLISIWINSSTTEELKFTMINLGKAALPIRSLSITGVISGNRQYKSFICREKNEQPIPPYGMVRTPHFIHKQSHIDLIIEMNQIWYLEVKVVHEPRIEVMYYDNSFEFIEIDTSNLGGKYILTGKGKKP